MKAHTPAVRHPEFWPDGEDYDLPCRYGNCTDTYDTATCRIWAGFGPVDCPHEVRGGRRGHGTWAEQYAPPAARKPSLLAGRLAADV